MSEIRYDKLEVSKRIHHNALVKVTRMNHIIEIVHVSNESDTLMNYLKVDKEHYVVINRDTGEVIEEKEYTINENRAQNQEGLKRTFKNIRDLINNNFAGKSNELFITLTYKLVDDKPMDDIKKASKDFDCFIKRFRRKYPDIQYLSIMEFQTNGAVHWHLLVKFTKWKNRSHIYIDNNDVIYPLWGHGWTNTKALNNVDNIGAYLSAYLGNVEINQKNKEDVFNNVLSGNGSFEVVEKEVTDDNGNKVSKKFVKGGRLHLYPSGANIYRCSKGIVKPVSNEMTYADAKKITKLKKPDFSRTIQISGGKENRVFNTVTYECYNLKRKKKPSV